MATIGLKDLVMATITLGEGKVPTYGTPKKLAAAISANLSVTVAEGTLYADDAVSESAKEFVKGALSLNTDDLAAEVMAEVLGMQKDADGVYYASSADEAPEVAVGFRAKKTGGKYRYIWLYRVKFKTPSETFKTKGESIEFNTPTIEGEFFTRYDGLWKADYVGTEGDAVAASFLSAVREKAATPTNPAQQGSE